MSEARILVAVVAVLLSACGVTVYPAQLETARTLCDAHDGVKFVEIGTSPMRAFIEAYCVDGVTIKTSVRDPR